MKQRRPKRRRASAPLALRGMLAKLPDGFYRLPEFSLRDGCLATDGCRRVLDLTPEKICLDMGGFLVTLYGTSLRIESLCGKRLLLAGRFTGITFQEKWKGTRHET